MANEVQTPADYLRWIQDVVEYHTDSELVSQDEICDLLGITLNQLICYREELGLPDPSWHESTRYFPKRAALIGIGKFLEGINKPAQTIVASAA